MDASDINVNVHLGGSYLCVSSQLTWAVACEFASGVFNEPRNRILYIHSMKAAAQDKNELQ